MTRGLAIQKVFCKGVAYKNYPKYNKQQVLILT